MTYEKVDCPIGKKGKCTAYNAKQRSFDPSPLVNYGRALYCKIYDEKCHYTEINKLTPKEIERIVKDESALEYMIKTGKVEE